MLLDAGVDTHGWGGAIIELCLGLVGNSHCRLAPLLMDLALRCTRSAIQLPGGV